MASATSSWSLWLASAESALWLLSQFTYVLQMPPAETIACLVCGSDQDEGRKSCQHVDEQKLICGRDCGSQTEH